MVFRSGALVKPRVIVKPGAEKIALLAFPLAFPTEIYLLVLEQAAKRLFEMSLGLQKPPEPFF